MTHSTRPPRRTRSGQADSSGNVIGQQGHYPFGESWYQSSTTTKWFFTDYERDAESGNDYASFRYNTNRFGRFSQPDLLAGSIADPQSLDRYPYVRGDPVNLVDPLGLTDCDPATQGQYAGCEPGDQTNGVPDSGVIFISSVDLCISCVYAVLGATAALAPTFDPGTVGGEWGGQDPSHGGLGQNPPDVRPTASDFAPASVISELVCPTAQSLDSYLQGKGSPLAGQGDALMAAGSFYNVDPRFIVALAGAETSYGKNITWGQYNAWNWGWNTIQPSNSPFDSWVGGIGAVTAGIAGRRYLQANPPRTTTASIYGTYCRGPGCANGLTNLNNSLTQQGGDPASAQFPQLCKN